MLHPDEETEVAAQFGVTLPQVRRDHLISHLLAALSAHAADQVVFFGGTALSRTFAPDGRLSEDIDLIATGQRRDVAPLVQERRELSGQTRLTVTAKEALTVVADAWHNIA
jgi:predicted nucleotidyltransferase component of viral defense system